jgi:hypothetical protein
MLLTLVKKESKQLRSGSASSAIMEKMSGLTDGLLLENDEARDTRWLQYIGTHTNYEHAYASATDSFIHLRILLVHTDRSIVIQSKYAHDYILWYNSA